MELEHSIFIKRPIEEVFEYVSNFGNHKNFGSAFLEIMQLSEGDVTEGTLVYKKSSFAGKEIETTHRVTDIIKNKLLSMELTKGPMPMQETFLLEEKEEGTQVTLSLSAQPVGLMKLTAPLLRSKANSQLITDLQTLKDILENQKTVI